MKDFFTPNPEREPQTSDDNLKEILGFDPETGESVEERGQLTGIVLNQLAIPSEIQESFENYVRTLIVEKLRVFPEELFTVSKHKTHIGRTYYRWYQSRNEEEENACPEFDFSSEATFKSRDKDYEPFAVHKWGESLYGESGNLHFLTPADGVGIDAQFEVDLQNRQIILFFDKIGTISTFLLARKPYNYSYPIGTPLILESPEIKTIIRRGSTVTKESFEDCYSLTYYRDNSTFTVERSLKGKVEDKIQFPVKINTSQIILDLFDPKLLHDPFNAPPELDDSWRFANLMETVGVKWKRY